MDKSDDVMILQRIVMDEYERIHIGDLKCDTSEFARRMRVILPGAIVIFKSINREQRRHLLVRARRDDKKILIISTPNGERNDE